MKRTCFTCAVVTVACCNALLPAPIDSFSVCPSWQPGGQPRVQRPHLSLRGGERTPPPAGAMQAHDGGGRAPDGGGETRLFAVEGLIGAGKSTLLAKLRKQEVPCPAEQ